MAMTVVTGGGNGIGLGVVTSLLGLGLPVTIFDASEKSADVAREVGVDFHRVDVTDPDALATAFALVAEAGPITGLVNSAGLTRTAPSEELAAADWRLVIDVDLSGTFYSCQAAAKHLAPGASIVNLASIAATRALPGRVAYTAAKFGVVGVTRVLAVEWADRPIRVNAVAPTWTETPLLADLVAAGKVDVDDLRHRVPMGRLATVQDIVDSILFLLSDKASFITGQTLYVDGGYTWAG
jgi:NAD(P)-dependent dehydrogenase (short-subunit alcohol dehydrogenase family)